MRGPSTPAGVWLSVAGCRWSSRDPLPGLPERVPEHPRAMALGLVATAATCLQHILFSPVQGPRARFCRGGGFANFAGRTRCHLAPAIRAGVCLVPAPHRASFAALFSELASSRQSRARAAYRKCGSSPMAWLQRHCRGPADLLYDRGVWLGELQPECSALAWGQR